MKTVFAVILPTLSNVVLLKLLDPLVFIPVVKFGLDPAKDAELVTDKSAIVALERITFPVDTLKDDILKELAFPAITLRDEMEALDTNSTPICADDILAKSISDIIVDVNVSIDVE